MAISTISILEEALKTYYLDPLVESIDKGSGPVLAKIEKNSDNIVANEIRFALQYGRHGGIGARGEDENLPEASPRMYKQGVCVPKNLFGRIAFSDKLMKTSKNNKASFVDQVSRQMEDITVDARDMMRRNIMGSSSGVMGIVDTSGATGVMEVPVKGNIKAFYPGHIVDIFSVSSSNVVTPKVTKQKIVDVDYAAGKIKFASNVTCAAGDLITLAGNYNKELIGLGEIMTPDTVIYGVDRAANKWYNPRIYDKAQGSTPQAFSSMYLQEAIDDINDFTGRKPDFITCNAGVQRAYINEQNTYKRNLEYMKVDGGVELISYNKTAISQEKYMPEGTIYLLDTSYFTLAQLGDWDWMDADGAILHRNDNKAAYEATLVKYCELICKMPSAQAKITGIQEL